MESIRDESKRGLLPEKVVPAKAETAAAPKTVTRPSALKYYIHDTTEAFRLQLIGELTEADVPELDGCWRTAKPTVVNRKIVLDLRALKAVDDAGKQWLAWMSTEGACYQPETYLKTCLAGQGGSSGQSSNSARKTAVGKVFAALRGLVATSAESSTQAP